MAPEKTAHRTGRARPRRPLPPEERVGTALYRLQKERALQTVIRGALPLALLRRLLQGAIPKREAATMPDEVWAAMAANVAAEDADYGLLLAQALHDRLAWDEEPAAEGWAPMAQERPLEALWMAALSETKAVRKGFPQLASECLRAFHASPASRPPSWEFVEEVLAVHGSTLQDLRDAEHDLEDAERRHQAERQRSDDLRDELKRLRRETSELRAEKAQAEKKTLAVLEAGARTTAPDALRIEELERRLRKSDKENEHLRRELERARPAPPPEPDDEEEELPPLAGPPPEPALPPLSEDPNPRRRVLRQMLRKLFKKGKIGASHTHEDNVYRGVPDHEKGIAKAAMDLLYREGVLMPKPTTTDPHVSLRPDRTAEVRAIVAGTIDNPRIRRFVEDAE